MRSGELAHRTRPTRAGQNSHPDVPRGRPPTAENGNVAICIRARSLYALLRDGIIHAYIRGNSTTCACYPHPRFTNSCSSRKTGRRDAQPSTESRGDKTTRVPPEVRCRLGDTTFRQRHGFCVRGGFIVAACDDVVSRLHDDLGAAPPCRRAPRSLRVVRVERVPADARCIGHRALTQRWILPLVTRHAPRPSAPLHAPPGGRVARGELVLRHDPAS